MNNKKNDIRVCGKTIRKHRIAWGLSQNQFGKQVDVAIVTINKLENHPDLLVSQRVAFNLANEIINNPPPENKPVWELINKWNEEAA